MTADTFTTIGGTVVQHGRLSDRIYVMHLAPGDLPGILDDLDWLAGEEGYSKIFTIVPASTLPLFLSRGYVVEARVQGFFRGREDGYFAAKFLDAERRRESGDLAAVLTTVREKAGDARPAALPPSRRDGRVPPLKTTTPTTLPPSTARSLRPTRFRSVIRTT